MPKPWVNIPITPSKWPFYYGWMIVACASIGIVASLPGQTIGVGVFVDFIVAAINLTTDNLSTAYLIATLLSSLTMPFAGRLIDRWGTRSMGVVASIGLGLSLGGFALCDVLAPPDNASWLRAMIIVTSLFFGIRFFGQGCLALVARVMLGRWFIHRRGLATSIASIFASIAFTGGGAWVLNALVLRAGWRAAYIILFLGIGVGHAMFAWAFFRDNPEQCGLPKDGLSFVPRRTTTGRPRIACDLTSLQAMKKVSFWAFNAGLGAHALLMTAVAFHLTAVGAESGLERHATYAVLLPIPIFSIGGSFLSGYLADRVDLRWTLFLMMTMLAVGLSGLLRLPELPGKLGIMVGLGVASGCFNVLSTVTFPHYFGQRHLGAINGLSMFLVVFSSALGPKIFSTLHAYSGSFESAISYSRVMPLCVIVLGIFAAPPETRECQ